MAYPTVGFLAVADKLEVNQARMAVNGIDEAVIAAEADGEAVCPPLKLLALVRVRQHIADGLDGFLPDLGTEGQQILVELTGVVTVPAHPRAD
jgi:hypothetical protein